MVDYSKFDGIGGSDEEEEENATSYEQLLEVEGIRTMGNGAVEKGDHARAVRLYRDALRKQPFPVGERGVELARTLRLNLATALLQLGDLGEAEKAAGVVLLKEPRDHHALRLRGTVRLKKGCHEEGIRDLKLALKTARNAEVRIYFVATKAVAPVTYFLEASFKKIYYLLPF
jgi:tetratricopeptide (TPR) repeat protein